MVDHRAGHHGEVMADASVPPPPPTGDPVGRPPLRRSRSDRVIAGVCGGIGRHFDVDPVLVRIGFVVLALFGGSGVLLYLVAWIAIARDGDEDSAAVRALRGHERRSGRSVLAIVLVIVGLLIIGGPFVWATGTILGEGLVLPLLLMAAGVALLVWPEEHEYGERRRHDGQRHEARAQMRRDITDARNRFRDEVVNAGDEIRTAAAGIRDEWSAAFDDTSTTITEGATPPDPASSEPPSSEPTSSEPPLVTEPRAPRPRPFIGPLTLAALLLFTGGAVALDRADVLDIDPAVGLAIALTIVGVALTVTAFVGRARGLIALGVILLPIVWWFHAVDLTWWDGIGEERFVVDELDELEDEYRYGIGQLEVDFSDLDLEGETHEVAVGLTIGEVIVIVPDDIEVVIDADGRIGEVVVDGPIARRDEGFDPNVDTTLGDSAGGTLELDLDIGLGSAKVQVTSGGS